MALHAILLWLPRAWRQPQLFGHRQELALHCAHAASSPHPNTHERRLSTSRQHRCTGHAPRTAEDEGEEEPGVTCLEAQQLLRVLPVHKHGTGQGRDGFAVSSLPQRPPEIAEGAAAAGNGRLCLVTRPPIHDGRELHMPEKGSQEERSTLTATNPALGFSHIALNQLFLCDSSPLLLYLPFCLPNSLAKAGLGIHTKWSKRAALISAWVLQPRGAARCSLPASRAMPAPGHAASRGQAPRDPAPRQIPAQFARRFLAPSTTPPRSFWMVGSTAAFQAMPAGLWLPHQAEHPSACIKPLRALRTSTFRYGKSSSHYQKLSPYQHPQTCCLCHRWTHRWGMMRCGSCVICNATAPKAAGHAKRFGAWTPGWSKPNHRTMLARPNRTDGSPSARKQKMKVFKRLDKSSPT